MSHRRVWVLALALTVATLFTGGGARAAMTLVRETEDGHTETERYDGDRVRVEGLRGDGSALIFDAGTKRAVIVYDNAKVFFDITKQIKKLRPALSKLKKALSANEALRRDLRYFPLREPRTINGFPCEMYDELTDGVVTEELCFTPWGGAVGKEQDHAAVSTFMEAILWDALGIRARRLPEPTVGKRPTGLSVWTQTINLDRSRGGVSQITSISFEALPAAIFSVPADYAEIDQLPDVHRGDEPRRYDPSLLGPGASSPASRSPSLGKISTVVAVLLLVMLSVGLFVHALFVHAAAGFVIEEPRYINAVAAALIVWIVWLPMELLHVPGLAQLPVVLLATFGALKVAYQTTTARTIALFAVSTIIEVLLGLAAAFTRGTFFKR